MLDESKKLYVRLFLRKANSWFRINQLVSLYSEITCVSSAVGSLISSSSISFVESSLNLDDFQDILSLLSTDELKTVSKELFCGRSSLSNKQSLISAIKKHCLRQTGICFSKSGVSLLFDNKGRKVNRVGHLKKRLFKITGQ